jgi:hypothetical protein
MTERKELLTVELARAWLKATEAERAREEARTRAMIVDRVLSDLVLRASWGLSVQSAGDEIWRTRGKHAVGGISKVVRETLEGVGWNPPRGAAKSA